MSKVAQAQSIVNSIVERKILDGPGLAYVIANTDPFHDREILSLLGMTDETLADQITYKAPYQVTVSAPVGQVGSWSMLIHNNPWTTGSQGSGPAATNFNLVATWLQVPPTQPNAQASLPSICIWRGNDGNPLGMFQSNLTGNSPSPIGLSLDDTLTQGVGRLIGWGLEVYDTSAVINKQGTVTVWRQNTNTFDKSPYFLATPNALGPLNSWGVVDAIALFRPPQTITEANQLFGTKSWRGEDGCYLVFVNNQSEQKARIPDPTQPIFVQTDFQAGNIPTVPQPVIAGSFNQITVGAQNVNVPQMRWNWQPYHQSGAFFTGLNPNATYLVRTVYYYERHPSINETNISLLTMRSAGYHPLAMEVRTRVLMEMPVGVPVGENALGDWFLSIAKTLSSVLKESAFPLFRIVGKAGNAILDSAESGRVDSKVNPIKTRSNLPQANNIQPAAQPRAPPPVPKVPKGGLPRLNQKSPTALSKGQKRRLRKAQAKNG